MLGDVKRSELLSLLLSKIFPAAPVSIIMAVNSLCSAITEKKHIDSAVLHSLSLASWYLPDDINIISRLAALIKETIINWTGASFLREGDGHQEHLYTSLAVVAVVASYFITDPGAPQRVLFRMPAFAANLLLRAHIYWKALGGMVQNGTLPQETTGLPAFEMDSSIETTSYAREATGSGVASGVPKIVITDFSSNSTATPEAFTKATVENRRVATRKSAYSVTERAHALAIERLMGESGLSGLQYCTIRQTETRQWQHGVEITHTYLNTQCDATRHPAPLPGPATVFQQQTDEPPPQANSAAEMPYVYTVIPMAASAVVPHGNAWIQALKSKVVMAAVSASALGGLAFGARKIWDKFVSWNVEEGDIPSSQAAYRGRRHHHDLTEREEVNRCLAKEMKKRGLLDETKRAQLFAKEEVIAAVGIALFASDPRFSHGVNKLDKRLVGIAKTILRAKKLYGGRRGEEISVGRAGMTVRNWLFDNVLGVSAEFWLAGKLAVLKHPGQFTADTMRAVLELNALGLAGNVDLGGLSDGKRLQFEKFWNYALDNTLPFRNLLETDLLKSLKATDDDFVWLSSAVLWLKDAGADLQKVSIEECRTLGKALSEMAAAGGMTVSHLRYFTLPALLFQAVNHPEIATNQKNDDFIHRLKAVNEYAEFRRTTALLYADLREKVNEFNIASKEWKSRGEIADQYVAQCPDNALIAMGNIPPPPALGGNPHPLNPQDLSYDALLKSGKNTAKQAYLNGNTPAECPQADVTRVLELKTQRLAAAFSRVDEYIIGMALAELDKSERDFINNAIIRKMSSKLIRVAPSIDDMTKELKNTDLFSASLGGEERIYTLVANKEGGYHAIRVDRDAGKYIQYDLFGLKNKKNIMVTDYDLVLLPSIVSGNPRVQYVQSFSPSLPTIRGADAALANIVQFIKEKHQLEFYQNVWRSGYDLSTKEKAWDFFKHLIPFYDCITEEFPRNIGSCLMDVLAFIPFSGQAASLGGKFGMALFRAAKAGMKAISVEALSLKILKNAATQAIKEVSLPTIGELASLSKTAVLTLDPGFGILAGAGKYSYKEIKKLAAWASAGKNADDIKNIAEITQKIKSVDVANPDRVVVFKEAFLPDSALKVPVKSVKQENGKERYVIVDPVTGEALGGFYYLDGEKLVSTLPGKLPKPDDNKFGKKGSGREKTGPEATDISSLCSGRSKRGIDEICASVAFRDVNVNEYIKFGPTGGHMTTGFFLKKLLEINPVRYKILKGMMYNAYSVSRFAAKEVSKMTNNQVIDSFRKYTGVKISEQQASVVRNKVQETKDACDLYYSQYKDRVLLYSGAKDGDAHLFFNYDTYGIFVSDLVFENKNPSYFMHSLLHEASHAVGTDDYFYLPKQISFSNGQSVIDFCLTSKTDVLTFYKKHLMKLPYENGVSDYMPGKKMYEELNIPQSPDLKMTDAVVNSRMKEEGVTFADWTVNNADSLSFYMLAVGTETERKIPHLMNVDTLFNDPKNMEKFPSLPD